MKKQILLSICSLMFGFGAFAQDIELHYEGVAVTSPEAEVDGEVGGAAVFKGYYIVNVSGAEVELSWTRLELFAEACISDQVCTDESCYTPFDDGATFNSPENATIPVGDSIYFKVGATSLDDPCCAINRYYLKTGLGIVQDSIDVKFRIGDTECFLSTDEEMVDDEITVFPNPASKLVNINIEANANNLNVMIYNVLGDLMLSANLTSGQNQINVESLPNGVYFYSIKKGENLIETKKLIVRQ